ncbi:MAG: hypothetical protein GMKNLPBB_00060 [Myxococcota bacterium]|nr:hypothetical protein [Myxococcota bacterium]
MKGVLEDGRSLRAARRRNQRREEILAATARLVAGQGYANTTVDDVIRAAGLSRGAFYQYFASREALFAELLRGYLEELKACVRIVHPESGSAERELHDNFERVLSRMLQSPDMTRALFLEERGIDPPTERMIREFYDYMHDMVAGALRQGAEHGFIRTVNENVIAAMIIGGLREVLIRTLGGAPGAVHSVKDLVSELLEFGLHGLLPGNQPSPDHSAG